MEEMGLCRRCRRYPRLLHCANEGVLSAAKTKQSERNAESLKSPLLVLSYVFGGVSTHQRDKVSIRSSSAAQEEAKQRERTATQKEPGEHGE